MFLLDKWLIQVTTALSLNFQDIVNDTSAVEEGGIAYGANEVIKEAGGAGNILMTNLGKVVALIVVIGFGIGLVWHHSNPQKMQEKKSGAAGLIAGILVIVFGVAGVAWLFMTGENASAKVFEDMASTAFGALLPFLRI